MRGPLPRSLFIAMTLALLAPGCSRHPSNLLAPRGSSGIAIALAGVAGVMVISTYSINASGGISWLLIAFVVMILAGEGNINAIIPAGVIFGLLEAGSVLVVGVPYRQAIALLVFIVVLMFKPQGLFAKRE